MGLTRRCNETSRYPGAFQEAWAKGIHPATSCQLCLPWSRVCCWKELFEAAGGTYKEPCSEVTEGDASPSGDQLPEQGAGEGVLLPFAPEFSAWNCPPEEEFGLGSSARVDVFEEEPPPPVWAGNHWAQWGGFLRSRQQ